MAKYVFGIDLGTTYSCIAYVDETGRATVVNNQEGTNTTPSVVHFESSSKAIVGQVAKELAVIEPSRTISLVKTMMGKTNFAINCDGHDFSPEAVSAEILKKLAKDASEIVGTQVKDVVITCPAYFGDAERKATRTAGEIADLNVVEIISEPTAAAIYYGCAKADGDKTILVYDLGGGTFDVTIMRISDGVIEEVCKEGDHDLGGKNWDDAVMQYLASQFCEITGFDGEFDEYAQQDLRIKSEIMKQRLTAKDEAIVRLDIAGLSARVNLTKADFESITQALLFQSIEKTDAAISVAESKGFKIDEILLVGGSTKMPQVARALTEKYGIEPKVLEPDEAVAKGAAIYALGAYEGKVKDFKVKEENGTMTEEEKEEAKNYEQEAAVKTDDVVALRGKTIKIELVANKSYALKVLRNGQETCCNMIIKNSKMIDNTVSVTKQFGTADDNQETAELVVYESDFDCEYYDVDEDFNLGTASLALPGNLPAGAPIQVTFTLNKEGMLVVTGVDMTSGEKIQAEMQATAGTTMSKEDVAAAKAKSKNIAVE